MKNNKSFCGLFLAALVLLPGCMRVSSYTRRPLQLFKNSCASTQIEQGVTLCAKQLSSAEKYYFVDGRTALLDDIEIIYFSVHNLSNKHYIISPHGIGMSQIAFHDVNRLIKKTNTITRFSGAAVSGGVIAFPFIILANADVLFPVGSGGAVVLLPFLGAAIVAIPLCCVFLVQGIKSMVMNHRISKDLRKKTLHKKVMIKSGDHYEGLIFVKSSDYRSDLAVTIHEKSNAQNSITFDVNVSHNE